jgi:hypothetical protein
MSVVKNALPYFALPFRRGFLVALIVCSLLTALGKVQMVSASDIGAAATDKVLTYIAEQIDDHGADVALRFADLLQADPDRKQTFFAQVGTVLAGLGAGEDGEQLMQALIVQNPELEPLASSLDGNAVDDDYTVARMKWWQKAIILVLIIVILLI